MTMKKQHLCLTFCIIFLVVGILSSCSRTPENSTKLLPKATEINGGTEENPIQKETIITETRQQFEQLTSNFFLNQTTNSTIDLHFTLKDPSTYGITDIPITFGKFNLEHMKEELGKYKKLKEQLDDINPNLLASDQQLTYKILYSTLEKELDLEGYELYTQPLGPTIGLQAQLPVLLAEYVFYNNSDIENYLLLLQEIKPFFKEIIEFEKQKAITGFFMSDDNVDKVIQSCNGYLVDPSESFLTETFDSRLSTVKGLTQEEIDSYKERNLNILKENFIPAYQMLIEELEILKGSGKNNQGICYFPNGTQYYEKLIASEIGSSYQTTDDLKKAIENQIHQDAKDLVDILKINPSLLDQLDTYQFALTDPNEILEQLIIQIERDYPALPKCNYTVKYVPSALESVLSPAFYLTPPLDQYEDNVIYINNGSQGQKELYPILAHEGYPGHLYQTVYFTNHSNSDLRRILSFSSYSEGWAVYVENQSYLFDNGLNPDLGKLLSLNSSSMLGLHAYLELNVNYYGWTVDQMKEYLSSSYGIEDMDMITDLYQTVIANPTNYLEYYVGYLEILNLRKKAERELNSEFNLKEFHTFILDIGPAPFDIINEYFDQWLTAHK